MLKIQLQKPSICSRLCNSQKSHFFELIDPHVEIWYIGYTILIFHGDVRRFRHGK